MELITLLERMKMDHLLAQLDGVCEQAAQGDADYKTFLVRALETVTDARGTTSPGEGWTPLVINHDRPLRVVNAMITGLHEPRATHLAMVIEAMAAAGARQPARQLERVYRAARLAGYLWHEFGDAHLILGRHPLSQSRAGRR